MLRHVKIVAEKKANGEEHTEEEMTLMAAQCLETGTSPFMTAMAQTALEDVLRKHEAIVRIERNIEEVAALFNDLAILVTAQGEQLDRIDDNVRLPDLLPPPFGPTEALRLACPRSVQSLWRVQSCASGARG